MSVFFHNSSSHETKQVALHLAFVYFRAIPDHKVCRAPRAHPGQKASQDRTPIRALQAYLVNR